MFNVNTLVFVYAIGIGVVVGGFVVVTGVLVVVNIVGVGADVAKLSVNLLLNDSFFDLESISIIPMINANTIII